MRKRRRVYRYRFYPTRGQSELFAKTFGCGRFAYNWALNLRQLTFSETGESLNTTEVSRRFTELKHDPAYAGLNEVSSVPLQQSLQHLDRAYRNFFEGRAAYPKFKKRSEAQTAHFMRNAFTWENGQLTLAKCEEPLDIRWSRTLPEGVEPSSVSIEKRPCGAYYVCFVVEEEIAPLPEEKSMVGVDLNCRKIVTSDGQAYEVPVPSQRIQSRRKRYERACARKREAAKKQRTDAEGRRKKSKNLIKAEKKVAAWHERTANQRKDWQHKLSTKLINENQVIAVETLAIQAMTAKGKGRYKAGLNKAMLNVGMAEFLRQLCYKAEWYGRRIVEVDRWFPSTKGCHCCGHVISKLPLSQRTWTCPDCQVTHDRDWNAAIRICLEGLRLLAEPLDPKLGNYPRASGKSRSVEEALAGSVL